MVRILVVEDHPANMELAVTLLEFCGYNEVEKAEDCLKAIEIAEDNTFDLILLDIHLPTMDGLEVLERLKNIDNTKMCL